MLHFYEDVVAHGNSLYYINNAHYSVCGVFGFRGLRAPVFLFNKLFGLAVNEAVLYFIGKAVAAGFFAAGLPLVGRLAAQLAWKPPPAMGMLFTALWPPAFFACLVMGQYDSICLLFILLALCRWMQGDMLRFSLWIGVGAACKFFPLLLVLPLLLLAKSD